MKLSFLSARLFICLVWQFFAIASSHGEVRAFTDNLGRIFRGELVSVTGDFVTIKRESDGMEFTVKAAGFSPADVAYFGQHGLKVAPAEAAKPAESATPLRLQISVTPKKVERNRGGGNYGTIQRITFKIEIHNNERTKDLNKAHGILLSEAKTLSDPDGSQLIGREEFDFNVPPLGNFTYETKEPAKSYFYGYDRNFGTRYSGHVLVLLDGAGKVINVTGSSDTIAKHAEDLRKLNVWDIFDKSYKKTKEGSPPMY